MLKRRTDIDGNDKLVSKLASVLVPGAMTFSHVGKIADLERLVCLFAEGGAGSARGTVSFPRKWRRAGSKRISEAFGCNLGVLDEGTRVHLEKLSHAAIGGLTNGAFALAWWGFDAAARYRVDLDRVPCAVRDPVVFLEPSAKLTVWRRLDAVERATVDGVTESWVRLGGVGPDAGRRVRVWDPRSGLLNGPTRDLEWVLAPTVHMGGKWIARPLSSKEKAQILDIREDWGALLANHFWRLDDCGFYHVGYPWRL
jgi:hypothetical protein